MAESGQYDQATIARRQKIAEAMLGDAMKPQKIEHWAQGLAQLGRAGIGGYMSHSANEDAKAEEYKQTADLYKAAGLPPPPTPEASPSIFSRVASAMSGGGQAAPETPVAAPAGPPSDQASYPAPPAAGPAPTTFRPGIAAPQAPIATAMSGDAASAIAGIESGGKYDKLGPVTKTGDRAYGKYQVMGANIPQWTKTHLGQEMTPDQFLANPQAQDAVFKGQFGQYAQKHGPEGAAKAWFAGERGMNNPNARDQLGTTVSAYADKFNRAYQPGQQPYEVAGPPTAAPQGPVAQAMAAPQMPSQPPAAGPSTAQSPVAQAMTSPTMPSGMFANVPKEKLPAILQGLTSKNPTMKALAVQELGNYTKAGAPTDEMREYNLDTAQRKARGESPLSFFDFKSGLRKAGATNVSVDASQKPENKFREKASTLQAERFDTIAKGGNDAKTMVSDLQSLRDIGSRITTGKTAQMTEALGPYAEALGVKIDGLDDLQAFKAITSRLAPQMRVPGSGATSDFEMRTFLEGLPGLGKTPGGNELISKTLESLAQHKIAAAEIASKALNEEITRKDADKMLRELPDPLSLWKQSRGEMKPQAAPKAAPAVPQAGEIRDGYRFKGGNPADQKNWEQVS